MPTVYSLSKVLGGQITGSYYCPSHATGVTFSGPVVEMEQV